MPTFSVERRTNLTLEESFQKIKAYLESGEGLKKLDANIQATFDESSKTGRVKGSQFEGNLTVVDSGGPLVKLEITIPFLLSPFKGKIQETLQRKLDKLFA